MSSGLAGSNSNPDRKGLTLAETMITLGIMAMLLSLGILSFRAPTSNAGSQGVAQTIAGQLMQARRRAISQHSTVALVIPSAGGISAYSQSILVLSGDAGPKTTQVINLAKEFPGAYAAVGVWDSPTPPTVDAPVQQNSPRSRFDISGWLSAAGSGYQPKDYVVAFTSDGKVMTNDLPWMDNQLHIVACSGVDFSSAASVPGTRRSGAHKVNLFQFNSVYQPNTVTITQEGAIWVTPGLVQANPGVVKNAPVNSAIPAAAGPTLGGAPNAPPVVVGIESFPKSVTPGTSTVLLPATGFVTLEIRVTDPTPGDQLCCRFESDPVGGGQAGTFSQGSGFVRMNWDPRDTGPGYPSGCWKATWVWTPPGRPGAYSTKDFEITGEVIDSHGAIVPFGTSTSPIVLRVLSQGDVIFSAQYQGRRQLFRMTPGTTSATTLPINAPPNSNLRCPVVSPDGSQLLYVCNSPLGNQVYVCNLDGSGNKLLYTAGAGVHITKLSWSPDGTKYVMQQTPAAIFVNNASPGATPVAFGPGDDPAWTDEPGHSWIAYVDPGGNVCLGDPSALPPTPVTVTSDGTPAQRYARCSWNKGSDTLFFQAFDGKIYQSTINYASTPPSVGPPTLVLNPPGPGLASCPLNFSGTPPKAVTAVAGGLRLTEYTALPSPTFQPATAFSIDTPAYTSGWDEVVWTR